MVRINAATKEWLIDNGLDQHTAHLWADEKTRKELLEMNFNETMHHLYEVYDFWYARNNAMSFKYNKETFFKDGPPKDMGFYPFTMTFRDVVGKDIRYDDYIYQYIRGVKRKGGLRLTLPTSEYLNMMTVWGKRYKPQMTFINYDTLPFNEKV